ncbi:MAG: CopG family transcriptional regulator [Comamonadaceae bacterium CG_4_9_14_3_um_filter_60_33]|nr:MAG: CopG family transcriptional regulator [Comamonadaceae bacterium CG_4_10_14_3_um_filter_60_42]PJB41247.1 MAG: CopG family transcriptional regulator [Comamonadaceae bacterium CG_4_9_14_3_um_filter_60_33]
MYNLYIMQIHQPLARTQIYLTETQQKRLSAASRRAAVSKSELIRLAVDQFLDQQTPTHHATQTQRLAELAGLWADRADMADPTAYVQALRRPRF